MSAGRPDWKAALRSAVATSANNGNTYESDYTNDQLWKLVRQAALKLSPVRPESLSTRKFDAGRETLGHPDAPSARWIAKRLGYPWPEAVRIGIDRKRNPTMSESAVQRAPAEKWLDHRHLHFALNYVARHRDERSFSEADYTATRLEVIAADGKKSNGGTLPMILPSPGQIMQIVRRIEKAEAEKLEAGKAPRENAKKGKAKKADGKKTRKLLPAIDETSVELEDLDEATKHGLWNRALLLARLEPYEMSRKRGVSFVEGIHFYIEATGVIPCSYEELKRLAKAAQFPLGRADHSERIAAYLPEVAAHRQALGLPMADEIGKRGEKREFDLTKLPGSLPKLVPQPGDWANNEEAVIDALCDYLDDAAKRGISRVTRADYRSRQEGVRRGEWPAAATLGRIGPKSFTAWIKRAQPEWQRRRKEKKAA
jgi:hypothetical protein